MIIMATQATYFQKAIPVIEAIILTVVPPIMVQFGVLLNAMVINL